MGIELSGESKGHLLNFLGCFVAAGMWRGAQAGPGPAGQTVPVHDHGPEARAVSITAASVPLVPGGKSAWLRRERGAAHFQGGFFGVVPGARCSVPPPLPLQLKEGKKYPCREL